MFPFNPFCQEFLHADRYQVSYTSHAFSLNLIPFKIIHPQKQTEPSWICANQIDPRAVILDSTFQQDLNPVYQKSLEKANDKFVRERWLREGQSPYTRLQIQNAKKYLRKVRQLKRKSEKDSRNHLVLSVESVYQQNGEIQFVVKMWNNQNRHCNQPVMEHRFGDTLSIYLENVIRIMEGACPPDII